MNREKACASTNSLALIPDKFRKPQSTESRRSVTQNYCKRGPVPAAQLHQVDTRFTDKQNDETRKFYLVWSKIKPTAYLKRKGKNGLSRRREKCHKLCNKKHAPQIFGKTFHMNTSEPTPCCWPVPEVNNRRRQPGVWKRKARSQLPKGKE